MLDTMEKRVAAPSRSATPWTERILHRGFAGAAGYPRWLPDSYETFRAQVLHPAYPCFFGTQAEWRGEMFYGFAGRDGLADVPATLAHFVALGERPEYRRNNFALFFEPETEVPVFPAFRARFWSVLRHLHDHDPCPQSPKHRDPEDPAFEFTFADCQMFVVGASPAYRKRRSRCLGPGMVMLFQPRAVFVDIATAEPISPAVRDRIRRRAAAWDGLPPHPDLGFYGDPGNLEWKQYCLPDDNMPATGTCPFLAAMRKRHAPCPPP